MKKIKIIIADDHKIFTNSLRNLLETDERFEIIAEVFNGDDVINCIDLNEVHIVLLDIDMPGKNGLDILKNYHRKENAPKFIVISMFTDDALLRNLSKFGAYGYLPKNLGKEELLYSIEDVINNVPTKLVFNEPEKSQDPFHLLTSREKEILKKISSGKSNQQIADEFFCSVFTVQTHRRNIHAKLSVKGQTALVNYVNLNMYRL